MEELAIYLLKSAGVLAVFALIYHFLLRRLTFFQSNRWFLLFGLFASVVFPFIEITQTVYVEQPTVVMPQQIAYTPMAVALDDGSIPPVLIDQGFDYEMLWFVIYAMLALFFIGKMSLELVSLFKLIRSGEVRYSGRFLLVSLSRKLTPFSFFHYICHTRGEEHLPEFDLILNHEKVHARQLHSLDVIISTVYRAIFWFNPLAWWVKKQITENLEFIADSQAKSTNTSSISYERTLLSVMACQQPALANNFFTPFIKQRIVMLQKETSARWHAYKYALILPIIVLFLYSFNVVEEIKYVEPTSVEDDYVKPIFKDRLYTISKETTDEEISGIVNMINVNENYHMDFINLVRDPDGQLLKMNMRLYFYAEPENVHTFSLGNDEISSERFEVIVSNNRFKAGIPNTPFYYTATKDGLSVMDQDDDSAYSHNDIIGSDPLLVFNGKQLLTSEIPKGTILSCDVVKVLKPSEAIKIYGARAKDGAMVYVGKTVVTNNNQ